MYSFECLSDSKSPQFFRTLLSIMAVLNNAVIWIVSTRLPTSKSSSPFNNSLVTVPKAPITIGMIVHFMFHSFFQFPSKVEVLILLFTFFQFYSVVSQVSKVDNFANSLFFFFCRLLLGLVFWQRFGDQSVCQSPIRVYVCHFLGQVLGCALLLLLLLLLFTPLEFLTSVLADGYSLWVWITASLQDSSQYSGRSQ